MVVQMLSEIYFIPSYNRVYCDFGDRRRKEEDLLFFRSAQGFLLLSRNYLHIVYVLGVLKAQCINNVDLWNLKKREAKLSH